MKSFFFVIVWAAFLAVNAADQAFAAEGRCAHPESARPAKPVSVLVTEPSELDRTAAIGIPELVKVPKQLGAYALQ
jgi:hypothetical protein